MRCEEENIKIVVIGIGYVGISNAILPAQHNQVIAVDLLPEKIERLNNRIFPIAEPDVREYLRSRLLRLTVTTLPASSWAPRQRRRRAEKAAEGFAALMRQMSFWRTGRTRNCLMWRIRSIPGIFTPETKCNLNIPIQLHPIFLI